MTPRERVYASLRKKPVDRVPIFMWLHPQTARALASELDIPVDALDCVMGNDVTQIWVNNNLSMEGVQLAEGESFIDDWGIGWTREGEFNQISASPLAGKDISALTEYQLPLDTIETRLAPMTAVAKKAARENLFLGCDVSPCTWELFWRLVGMEDAFMALAEESEIVSGFLERAAEMAVTLATQAAERFPLDWIWTGDDLGTQQTMMMSPDCWRKLIKPHLAKVVAAGKQRGLFVAYHSCGAIHPVIDDLIEIGVDVLNPLQCRCRGMQPLDLKKEFGDRIAFMGGVDTQELLVNGTAREVFHETAKLIDDMSADGGGYILAASHTVAPETPLANIFAMYEAAGITRKIMDETIERLRDECAV